MDNLKALEQLGSIRNVLLDKYSNYQGLTNQVFDMIVEMLSIDFSSVSSSGKRLQVAKENLIILFKCAFENNGHKNYLRDILNVFLDQTISDYINSLLGNVSNNFSLLINRLKYEFIYWQGSEKYKFEKIEDIILKA